MKKGIYKVLLGTLVFAIFSTGAKATSHKTSKSGVWQYTFKASSVKERTRVAQHLHLDHIDLEKGLSQATVSWQAREMVERSLSPLILKRVLITAPSSGQKDFPAGDGAYHTYRELNSQLQQLQKRYPRYAKVFSFGQSLEGRKIYALEIGDFKERSSSQLPSVLFLGTHHAREHLSTEIPLLLAKEILSSTQKLIPNFEEVPNLLKSRRIFIVPMLNPDGVVYDIKGGRYKMWRKNRRKNPDDSFGVDLNRNYSYRWGGSGSSEHTWAETYRGPKAFSEPETQAVEKFVDNHPQLTSIFSFHTYSELILYPWGHTTEEIGGKDQLIMQRLAQKLAKWNGYRPMQTSSLYVASGDTCDWAWGEKKIYCWTFELSPRFSLGGGGFYPGAKAIAKTYAANRKGLAYILKWMSRPAMILEKQQ